MDATTLLTVYLVIRLALPSQLVVTGLRSMGSPAVLLSLALLAAWAAMRLHRTRSEPGSPVLLAAWLFACGYTASLVPALLRPISSEELNSALFGTLTVAGWLGVLSLAHDGPGDRVRLAVLVNRLVLLVSLVAFLGLIQFLTGQAWVDRLGIPGLTPNGTLHSAFARDRFTRPSGTAIHPIEFGALLSMVLPLSIVRGLGRLDPGHAFRSRLARWTPCALIAVTIFLSSSRSAWIGMGLGIAALLPLMNRRERVGTGLLLVGSVSALFVGVPGMLGVVQGMFTDVGADPSIRSRVEGYAIAVGYIGRSPWWGRGLFTFLPRYQIFDNQYLLSLVETGFVGVGALAVLIVAAAAVGIAAARRRHPLAPASVGLTVGVVVGAVALALFDGFSFPMMAGVWFLLLGLLGACSRLTRSGASPTRAGLRRGRTSGRPSVPTVRPRRGDAGTPRPSPHAAGDRPRAGGSRTPGPARTERESWR